MSYKLNEMFGREKRDLLKSNVVAARNEQQEASEEFKDALTQLKELYGFEGGELEKAYHRFDDEYQGCVDRANDVRDRVKKVNRIATDLFREWETELETISTASLRSSSRRKLNETRSRFNEMFTAMEKAEASMDPVLTLFRDHVLYLKHNLNAQAVASLRGEAVQVENEIEKLIADMNRSIAQADEFIKGLE